MGVRSLQYRYLLFDECERIREIKADQYIGRAWRVINGCRQLLDIDYYDKSWPNGYATHLLNLQRTIKSGGAAPAAFGPDGTLLGFAAVNRQRFGSKHQYVLLDQLFISSEYRGKGIGRRLLRQASMAGSRFGAEALYIAAGSAEETIAFYRSCGCTDVLEIDNKLQAEDPRDLHLEFPMF